MSARFRSRTGISTAALMLAITPVLVLPMTPRAASAQTAADLGVDQAHLIQPAQLAATLRSSAAAKPLVLYVGFRVLYEQAHIPGAEYIGASSEPAGLGRLRARIEGLPKDAAIVLYCGCCPWSRCPNVKPAYAALQGMGFTNAKVLWISDNFGVDWVSKGYPVAAPAPKP
jgi:thiosulfate/3-mercaptopyruvate sulfurtransferase